MRVFFVLFALLTMHPIVITGEHSNTNNPKTKKVLILHSYHSGFDWTNNISRGIEEQFVKSKINVEIYYEYMDSKRSDPDIIFPVLYTLYREKYEEVTFDVILLSDNNALNFILKFGEKLFHKTPVVFCGINNFTSDLIKGHGNITGVVEAEDIEGTIDLILQVHENLDTIYVLSDSTITGNLHLNTFRRIKKRKNYKVNFVELYKWSTAEIGDTVASLKENSVILILAMHKDKNNITLTNKEVQEIIEHNSKVPCYSMWEYKLNYEITGGIITSGRMQGREAAKKAVRILNGIHVSEIRVLEKSPNIAMFNYNKLIKFGISKEQLPSNSTILNVPETFYEKNKSVIWGVLFFSLFQFVVIIILFSNILKRKRAEVVIKKSLKEKDILVKEIHHRVKNNLQIVISLIQLQLERIDDEKIKNVFTDLYNRMHSMGMIHQKLYKNRDFSIINYKEYIHSLINELLKSYNINTTLITVDMFLDEISMNIESAIPCGLLINEIVSNSLKHAFPENTTGNIRISMKNINGRIEIVISDNGIGIPKDIDVTTSQTLGMQLITSLSHQLEATLKIDRESGTTYTIVFSNDFLG